MTNHIKRLFVSLLLCSGIFAIVARPVQAATVTPTSADVSINANIWQALSGISTAVNISEVMSYTTRFGTGTGTGNLNLGILAVDNTNLAASGSVTYNLASYSDIAGNTVSTLTKLKILWIKNTGTVALEVGAASADQFIGTGFLKDTTDVVSLAAGQVMFIVVPVGITVSGTVKNLKILNTSGATAGAYQIVAAGSAS